MASQLDRLLLPSYKWHRKHWEGTWQSRKRGLMQPSNSAPCFRAVGRPTFRLPRVSAQTSLEHRLEFGRKRATWKCLLAFPLLHLLRAYKGVSGIPGPRISHDYHQFVATYSGRGPLTRCFNSITQRLRPSWRSPPRQFVFW